MIRSYLKIAWRNIIRRKFYSALNIVGLATGMVFTLLIGSYVWNELQVNRKLRHSDRQFLLKSEWKDPNMGFEIASVGPLAKQLKEEYPTLVANYYRFDGVTSQVSKGDRHFRESLQVGDSTLLSVYGFQLLHGNPQTALNNPYSVVISAEKAIKYFGRTDVVGETLSIQSFGRPQQEFAITGVLKAIPANSVTKLVAGYDNDSFFLPISSLSYFGKNDPEDWSNIYIVAFIELQAGVTPRQLEGPIHQLLERNSPDFINKNLKVAPIPIRDYYFQQNNGLVKRMLYALSFTGLFILLMAVVNFVNISISNSSSRMKEIGLRKVLGGLRKQVILQFLAESFLLVLVAMGLSLFLYPFLRPAFEQMVGKEIPGMFSFPFYFIGIPLLLALVIGVLAGLYPAIVLSSLKSVDSLKGKLKGIKDNVWVRKSLAGVQFCLAAIVMITAFIVSRQVSYFFGRGLGYNKEYIVSSQVPRDWSPAGTRRMEAIRNELAALPEVAGASLSFAIPDGESAGPTPVYRAGADSTTAISMQTLITDAYFPDTYQVPMESGQFFSETGGRDSTNVILNEKAAETLGWRRAGEAVGQQVRLNGSGSPLTVIGVTRDFHFNSMQQEIPPLVFFDVRQANVYRYLSLKIRPGHTGNSIAAIEKKWAALLPGSSFDYKFMDESLKNLYKAELQLKQAAYAATLLSFVIVLLGVLGMVSLSIQKRTKEIGIRKVLGASLSSIVNLFTREFLLIIVIAGAVACPVAWLLMKGWLNNYAYRISMTAVPFLAAMLILGTATVLLIMGQTVRAGLANPVRSLRSE